MALEFPSGAAAVASKEVFVTQIINGINKERLLRIYKCKNRNHQYSLKLPATRITHNVLWVNSLLQLAQTFQIFWIQVFQFRADYRIVRIMRCVFECFAFLQCYCVDLIRWFSKRICVFFIQVGPISWPGKCKPKWAESSFSGRLWRICCWNLCMLECGGNEWFCSDTVGASVKIRQRSKFLWTG